MTESDQAGRPLRGHTPDRTRMQSERIRVLDRQVLSDNWATLEKVTFEYHRSDGRWQTQTREIFHRGHGAAVLLYNTDYRTIVLVRQFRFPSWTLGEEGFLLEVPAGVIESDDAVQTVREEAEQETGFVVDEPVFLYRAFCTPGAVTECIHYYMARYDRARRSGSGGGLQEEGEDIEVLEMDFDEALSKVSSGEIADAKTILLLQYAQLHVFGNATD